MGMVSLVLATYGRCDDVGRMLDSLAAQTDTNFEVLIVDQNPDERLRDHVARGLASGLSIRHLRMERPSLSGARNLGITQAKGEIIGFPDDDCWYEPGTIAELRSAFGLRSNVDGLVGCWVEQTQASGGGSPVGRLSYEDWRQFRGGNASSITLFFHRHLFELLGGFDERFGVGKWYGAGEETDFILRALSSGARLEYCHSARVHHAFSHSSAKSFWASLSSKRGRGRGTGGIYAKHDMSAWVILRGIVGQVARPLFAGQIKTAIAGISAFRGSLEGFLKWRIAERKKSSDKPDSSLTAFGLGSPNVGQRRQAPCHRADTPRSRVVIIQRRMTHYRIPLFELMRDKLGKAGIDLIVVFGDATPEEQKKADAGALSWGGHAPCTYWLNGRLCWQDARAEARGADLVVVTQENKLIQNHLLLLLPRRFKLAFWGHGANMQSANSNGFKERFKRWTTNRVDWWFAYTQMSKDLVTASGFSCNRITVLNNAVDTSELHRLRQSLTQDETHTLRESLDFGSGPAGVFVGSLYADKRLDFLFAAAEAIRREVPDFHLLIVGEGSERDKVQAWCAGHPWARWVGARFGREKAACVSVAQVMLNPGALGLGVMDAFVCQAPVITTNCGNHGPEISYLKHGINGVMTEDDLNAYVEASVNLLRNADALDALRAGCAASAAEYTVENMARNFANGVMRCLGVPPTVAGIASGDSYSQ